MSRSIRRCALFLVIPIALGAQGLQLLTPEPGAVLAGGQVIAVTWSASSAIETVTLGYTWDDGMKYWESMTYSIPNTGTCSWRVPYFKTAKSNVMIRIVADGINIADTINGSVSIEAMTPDGYEPNNDSAHATALAPGDTLKECISTNYGGSQEPQWRFCPVNQTGCTAWQDSMTAYADPDWFRIDVPEGKILNIAAVPGLDSGKYNDQNKSPKLMLWNAAGTLLATNDIMMKSVLRADVRAGGGFYCSVNYSDGQKTLMPHERAWYVKYALTAWTEEAASFALLSPAPGSSLPVGEKIMVTWSAAASISSVSLSYCWDDSMKYWESMTYSIANTGSCAWRVPWFKTVKPCVWIRITAEGVSLADTIDGPVSIAAATADVFEPNDDSLHATTLVPGDTLKTCVATGYGGSQEPQWRFCPSNQTGCTQWQDSMAAYVDADWFKIDVASGKNLTVRAVPGLDSGKYNDQNKAPKLTLFDAAGTLLATNDIMMQTPAKTSVANGGRVYCAVNYTTTAKSLMPHERAWYFNYSIAAACENADLFSLTAPQPGVTLAAGQIVPITWSTGTSISEVSLSYSWDDSMKYWEPLTYAIPNSGHYSWRVPYFKTAKTGVRIRIVAGGINSADTIDGTIAIAATAADGYEPNDDSLHATTLAFGDTLKNCITTGYGGSQEPQWRFCPSNQTGCTQWQDSMANYVDADWFAINASASKLVQVRAVASLDSGKYNDQHKAPKLTVFDGSGAVLVSNDIMMHNGMVRFNSGVGGVFFCAVNKNDTGKPLMPHERAWYFAFAMVAKIVADLEVLDVGPGSYVAKNGSYELTLAASESNIDIAITAAKPAPGTISLATLPIDSEVVSLAGQGTGLTIISIDASDSIVSVLQQATIGIPYSQSSAGNDEKKIEAKYFNDSTNEWEPVSFTVDSTANTVTLSTTHFSIYGLFIADKQTSIPRHAAPAVVRHTGISTCGMHNDGTLSLHYGLTRPGAVRIAAYGIDGKKYAEIVNDHAHPAGLFSRNVNLAKIAHGRLFVLDAVFAGRRETRVVTMLRR